MANSLTQIYAPIISSSYSEKPEKDKTSLLIIDNEKKYKRKKGITTSLAAKFKYQANSEAKDIEEIRKLLLLKRRDQSKEEYDFWTPDYERMKKDDWLVTRFLLRGLKRSQKSLPVSGDGDGENESRLLVYRHTMELVESCANFRRFYQINPCTKLSEFPVDWIKVNGLFNYKTDLAGNPTIYLRCCLHKPKLIETKEARHEFKRLLLYTLEKCDQDLMNNMGKGVCCIFDMSEATFENVDLELASWMIKSFKSCSPKLLAYVIVYNLPWFFSATFKLLTTTLMSNSNKQCLKFVYGNEILKYVEYDNLPEYISSKL